MIKFTRRNLVSIGSPLNVYEATFDGYYRGTSFTEVRIVKGKEGFDVMINGVRDYQFTKVSHGWEFLREAKAEALSWKKEVFYG